MDARHDALSVNEGEGHIVGEVNYGKQELEVDPSVRTTL